MAELAKLQVSLRDLRSRERKVHESLHSSFEPGSCPLAPAGKQIEGEGCVGVSAIVLAHADFLAQLEEELAEVRPPILAHPRLTKRSVLQRLVYHARPAPLVPDDVLGRTVLAVQGTLTLEDLTLFIFGSFSEGPLALTKARLKILTSGVSREYAQLPEEFRLPRSLRPESFRSRRS